MRTSSEFLVQAGNVSQEVRVLVAASLLKDWPLTRFQTGAALPASTKQALLAGRLTPVGSVEFLVDVMQQCGIPAPPPVSYPPELASFLKRDVRKVSAAEARQATEPVFLKPLQTKRFSGFVWQPGVPVGQLSDYDREQGQLLAGLPDACPLWLASPVGWLAEYRVYVLHRAIIGVARYDAGDAAGSLDWQAVEKMVARAGPNLPVAWALDVGQMATGETALVECNDAWSLGYYRDGNLPAAQYAEMLVQRWRELATAEPRRQ